MLFISCHLFLIISYSKNLLVLYKALIFSTWYINDYCNIIIICKGFFNFLQVIIESIHLSEFLFWLIKFKFFYFCFIF